MWSVRFEKPEIDTQQLEPRNLAGHRDKKLLTQSEPGEPPFRCSGSGRLRRQGQDLPFHWDKSPPVQLVQPVSSPDQ